MNFIKDISLLESEGVFNGIIEIPIGTTSKFELVEPKFDDIKCVRKVKRKYPFYYGCFPQTLAGDNDPLDMILFSNRKRKTLDIVSIQVIGVIKTIDNGEIDDKILCIASDEPIEHLDKWEKRALKFLSIYKGKNSNTIIDTTIYDCKEALKLIEQAHTTYLNKYNKTNKTLSSF